MGCMDVQGWPYIYVTEIIQLLGIPTGTMSRKSQRFQAYAQQTTYGTIRTATTLVRCIEHFCLSNSRRIYNYSHHYYSMTVLLFLNGTIKNNFIYRTKTNLEGYTLISLYSSGSASSTFQVQRTKLILMGEGCNGPSLISQLITLIITITC